MTKRLFDILVSAPVLILLSPLLALLALLVRFKLGSPVLFRQVRPGKGAKPFEMLKFRTMTDARGPDGKLLPDAERLTPFGRFLRSTSLDELPELWNVLKGDMSLVGPRPLAMAYLPLYSPKQARRHDVKPGLTGWAQVNGRNTITWRQKFVYDVWYVDNQSLWLDVRILLLTAKIVLLGAGVAAGGQAEVEVRDLWPQTLIDMGRLSRGHPAALMLRWLEKSLYRDAARVIVLLPRANEYIERLGVSPEKIVWIPNGVDIGNFPAHPPRQSEDVFTLMYFGAHGGANGLDNLLAAMRYVEAHATGRHIILRLIGDGPLKPALEAAARDMGLANVRFEDPVPKNRIPALAAQADAFVLCVKDLPGLYRFGVSMNKIFDYMAAGRPIVISIDSVNNPIAEAGAGLTVAPENPRALADAIVALASSPSDERARMGAAGRRHLEDNYDMRRLATRLACALDDSLRSR